MNQPAKQYIHSLDGLRAVGMIAVFLYHLSRQLNGHHTEYGFAWIFIQMFFVQSGYLITNILIRKKDLSAKLYFKSFFQNRILRIFPVYYLYILGLFLFFLIFNKAPDFLNRLPYFLSYTYNYVRLFDDVNFYPLYAHLWSLSVEEQFYLIWPLIVFFVDRKYLKHVIVGFVIICPIIRFSLGQYLINFTNWDSIKIGEAIYGFTFSQLDAFAVGGAIAVFDLKKIKNSARIMNLAVILVVIICIINFYTLCQVDSTLRWTSLGLPLAELKNLQYVWSYTLINLLFMIITIRILQVDYKGILTWNPLVKMGKVVYACYVFHFAIVILLAKLLPDTWFPITLFIGIILTYIVGQISYTFFEKKFLAFKSKI